MDYTTGTVMDTLKKKMRQAKAEMARAKEEHEDTNKQLSEQTAGFDAAEQAAQEIQRKIHELEERFDEVETKLNSTIVNMEAAVKIGDENKRQCKTFEQRSETEKKRQEHLQEELKTAKMRAESAEQQYDIVCQKLQGVENNLEEAEDRADAGFVKIIELEEELKVVGSTVKSLEVSEEKATERESNNEEHIRELSQLLREVESRATYGDRCVRKLQKDIDKLEDQLLLERERNKTLTSEVTVALAEIQGM